MIGVYANLAVIIPANLRRAFERCGRPMAEVCASCYLSRPSVTRYLSGECIPTADRLIALCRELGVPLDVVVGMERRDGYLTADFEGIPDREVIQEPDVPDRTGADDVADALAMVVRRLTKDAGAGSTHATAALAAAKRLRGDPDLLGDAHDILEREVGPARLRRGGDAGRIASLAAYIEAVCYDLADVYLDRQTDGAAL